MLRLGIAAGFLGGAGAAFGACLLPEVTVGETETQGTDAGPDIVDVPDAMEEPDVVVEPPCMSVRPPSAPDAVDGPPVPDIVLALRTIDMGDTGGPVPGYDLDRTCTCKGDEGGSCKTPPPQDAPCDGEGGVDNAASVIFKSFQMQAPGSFGSVYYSMRAEEGLWGLLIRIWNYNGKADDPNISVALYVSPGTATKPVWDSTDVWFVSADSVNNKNVDEPVYLADGAHVVGGVMVATVPAIGMRFSGGMDTISVRLVGGVLTGKLNYDGKTAFIEDGVLAGRWTEPDIFASLSSFRGNNGFLFCNDGNFIYGTAKGVICGHRDVLSTGFDTPSAPCDSLSLGIGFHAEAAKIGTVKDVAQPTPGCTMPSADPKNDSCSK